MASKDPRIDDYIANAAPFAQPILKYLRKIVHAGCPAVQETMKWSMPHFDHRGVMCRMAGFKQHCAFGFWKGELIFHEGKTPGESAMGEFGRITALSDLPADEVLIGYVQKAARLNEEEVKSPERAKPKTAESKERPLLPAYFTAALQANAAARKTFENFTPGKQRDYVNWVTEAKRDATREQRLSTAMEWLAEGKPYNWKYQTKA